MEYQKEYELYLRDQFTAADRSKNGYLFLPEFTALLKQLNIDLGEMDVEKVFEEANTDKRTKVGGGCMSWWTTEYADALGRRSACSGRVRVPQLPPQPADQGGSRRCL